MQWLLAEFPPLYIPPGQPGAPGYGMFQARFLADRLPGFAHVILTAPTTRIWREMAGADAVCTVAAAKLAEREVFALYAQRSFQGPLSRILLRRDDVGRFHPHMTAGGEVDLRSLARDETLSGAYAPETTYGTAIDSLVADPGRRVRLAATPHQRLPLTLLDRGRVDFLFGNAMELAYQTRRGGFSHQFLSLPVFPAAAPIAGHVVCSRGPIGSQVIAAIDRLQADDATMLAFIEPLKSWYGEDEFSAAAAAISQHQ